MSGLMQVIILSQYSVSTTTVIAEFVDGRV